MAKITPSEISIIRHAAEEITYLSDKAFSPQKEEDRRTNKLGLLKHRDLGEQLSKIADKLETRLKA